MQLAHLITDAYQNQVAPLPSWGEKKKNQTTQTKKQNANVAMADFYYLYH